MRPKHCLDVADNVAVRNVLGILDQNNNVVPTRQVSRGSVFAVGGVAPRGNAINNGYGQLVRSGTNARLFRTAFPTARPKVEDELEKHEARLAKALGIDRARRTIDVNVPHCYGENRTPTKSPTQWDGTQWVQEDAPTSKLLPSALLPEAVANHVDSSRAQETRELPAAAFK